MAGIAALCFADRREAFGRELEGLAVPCLCESVEALRALLASRRVDVVLIDLDNGDAERLTAEALDAVAAATPSPPAILRFTPAPAIFRKLPAYLSTGARIACALRGHDELGVVTRQVCAPGWLPGPAARLLPELLPVAAASLHPFLIAFLARASWHLHVATVARWIGDRERTLRDRFARNGLLTPVAMRGYCLALWAGWLLAERDLKPVDVAARMECPDLTSLNRLLRVYARWPAGAFKRAGEFPALCRHVTAVLQGLEPPRGRSARRGRRGAMARPRQVYVPPAVIGLGAASPGVDAISGEQALAPLRRIAVPFGERERHYLSRYTDVREDWPLARRGLLRGVPRDGVVRLFLTEALDLLVRFETASVPAWARPRLFAIADGVERALDAQWGVRPGETATGHWYERPVTLVPGQPFPVTFGVRAQALLANEPRVPDAVTRWVAPPVEAREPFVLLTWPEAHALYEFASQAAARARAVDERVWSRMETHLENLLHGYTERGG